ncbi:glycosyltransferase family 4 protein [Pedococcus sp. KACC 23699]|uniref:D-inositol 3-phosphate glycosyltransferase n=1 Tax=Pedococcus sp. KACC 23699 TaxID=3149228 RepID=A0AAU7JTY4_9MICO
MRIAMVVGRSTGGIGLHAVDLAAHLRSLGDDVVVVTDDLTAERFELPDALRWWPDRRAGVRGALRSVRRLRGLARSSDVVHAHGHQAGLFAVLAATGTSTPVVVSQHNAVLSGAGPRALVSRVVQTIVARRAALVTGASSDLVQVATAHGARAARLAPVPSPRVPALAAAPLVDVRARAEAAGALLAAHGIPATGALVLTISRIAPQKSLDVLVDAAVAVAAPIQWVVVGDGDTRLLAELRRRAGDRGAPVHFIGAVTDPTPWLRAAEVFVLPSRWEARALVVQEAMAAGLPVVAADTGGLHDLVDGAGVLVPVGDAPGFARAVESVLGDPERRGRLSQQGRERATSWDDGLATARRWREWYSALPGMT